MLIKLISATVFQPPSLNKTLGNFESKQMSDSSKKNPDFGLQLLEDIMKLANSNILMQYPMMKHLINIAKNAKTYKNILQKK